MRTPLYQVDANSVYEKGKAALFSDDWFNVLSRCRQCRLPAFVYKVDAVWKVNADTYKTSEIVLTDIITAYDLPVLVIRKQYCDIINRLDQSVRFEGIQIKDRSKKLTAEITDNYQMVIPERIPVLISDRNTLIKKKCDTCKMHFVDFLDIDKQRLDGSFEKSEFGIGVTIPEALIGSRHLFCYGTKIIATEALVNNLKASGMNNLVALHFGHMVDYDMNMELYISADKFP